MITEEYSKSAVEVLDILDKTQKQDMQKIPSSFIQFLVDIADSEYKVNFDHSKPMSELGVKDKTKEILGYIYLNWWCEEKEKQLAKIEIEKRRKKKQEELAKRYNSHNLFKKKEKQKRKKENLELVQYKESFFCMIKDKITKFFQL